MPEAQTIKNQKISEYMIGKSRLCEMVSDNSIDVPIDPRIDIDIITADDPDPKFVNVEIIRAGISKTNNRRYNNVIVREVHDLMPGIQGFYGHPDPAKEGFEFREPQCIYVGSIIEHMPDGIDRCIAKAYLFKTSKLREWIPKSIAAGNPMTVSINGSGDIMRSSGSDVIDVIHMSELQSVDWANPGTEGMYTSQAISVVKEMQNGGGENMPESITSQKDIIRNTTIAEFRAYNPDGYDNILKGVTVAELQAKNPDIIKQIVEDNKIAELALKVGGKEEKIKISELQGVVDKLEQKIETMDNDIKKAKISEMKSRLLGELVPEQYRDKVGARVTGDTEDAIKESINSEIAYIREIGGSWDNMPVGMNQHSSGDDMKSMVAELFGHKVDKGGN